MRPPRLLEILPVLLEALGGFGEDEVVGRVEEQLEQEDEEDPGGEALETRRRTAGLGRLPLDGLDRNYTDPGITHLYSPSFELQ